MSEWGAPVVIVSKIDKTLRFCIDYRRLNQVTQKDSYPLSRMDEWIHSLGDATVFCTFDCSTGYWEIPVAEEDIPKTAFVCHRGMYDFLRMPFNLTNAPATFQRAIVFFLSGVKWKLCLVYLDDVIVISKTLEENTQHVDEVLTALRDARVTLRLQKYDHFKNTVQYLGHDNTPGKLGVLEYETRSSCVHRLI